MSSHNTSRNHNKSYSEPIPRKNDNNIGNPVISLHQSLELDIKSTVNENKVMICGSEKSDIKFIRRFMNQVKNCIIITGSAPGVEHNSYINGTLHGFNIKSNKNYSHIKDNSIRLFSIYTEEKPSKIYIIDDDYEGNLDKYHFCEYLPKTVDVIVVKTHYYY